MNLKKLAYLLPILACVQAYAQNRITVSSPDKKLSVSVELDRGLPSYSLQFAGRTFLQSSPLGIVSSIGDFILGLNLSGYKKRTIKETYFLKHSKTSKVNYYATELICSFINAKKDTVAIVFRVSNTDVAFLYRIPKNGRGTV